jgi:hypothetical protein
MTLLQEIKKHQIQTTLKLLINFNIYTVYFRQYYTSFNKV